ncbi:MAG: TIM barrel protein [Oscillospiraceae bacterium]
MSAKFGPAGNADSFKTMGYKKTIDVPLYIEKMGLDAYEYQCTRGVKISHEAAREFGDLAKEKSISLSVHTPYYISLSSTEKEKRDKSIEYILESGSAADAMGARKIIIHSGSCSKLSREDALEFAKDTLKRAREKLLENGLGNIILCPEVMGKTNQLGTVEEVMELCKIDETMLPCVDFGHVNSRTFGSLKTSADFEKILDTIENALGKDRLNSFHSHFSKIEYSEKGGEVRHLTFEDREYGPDFEPLLELIYKKGLSPTFICESRGTQAEDALLMKKFYNNQK